MSVDIFTETQFPFTRLLPLGNIVCVVRKKNVAGKNPARPLSHALFHFLIALADTWTVREKSGLPMLANIHTY